MAALSPRVAVSALFAIDGAVLGGWMAHLPDVQRQHGLDPGRLGFVLIASSVGAISGMGFTGALIRRFGSRGVCAVCVPCVLAIVPLLLWASSPAVLALTLFAMGMANGTLDVAMNSHAIAVQRGIDRPILSSVHGWFCIGGFLGGIGTSLANVLRLAPRPHLALASGLLLTFFLLTARGLLSAEQDQDEEGVSFALPRGPLLALGFLTLIAFFAEGVLWDWSAVFLRSELKAGPSGAALGFGLSAGSMAVGRLLGDRVVARCGPAGALRLAGGATCGGIVLCAFAPTLPVAFLGLGLAGLGLANAVPVLFAAASRVPGTSSGAGLAAVTSLGYAAFLGGPPLIGRIAEATSLRSAVGLVGLSVVLIGLYGPRSVEEKPPVAEPS